MYILLPLDKKKIPNSGNGQRVGVKQLHQNLIIIKATIMFTLYVFNFPK